MTSNGTSKIGYRKTSRTLIMKIAYKNVLTLVVLAFAIAFQPGCTKDFEEINTNPNAPVEVQPQLLLRQVIYDMGEQMSYEGFVAGNLLGQYFSMVDFNLFDRHNLRQPQLGGNPWPVLYRNLRDNQTLIQLADVEPNTVYRGPSLVLKAYISMMITDIYGDVPYSEAARAKEGIIAPKYDNQQEIYLGPDGILATLERAVAEMKAYQGAATLQGDILYNGNLTNWIALANSLRIKALMRISDRQNVGAQLQTIVNTGEFIKTASQNARFSFTDGAPNNFRMATLRSGDFNLYVLSTTFDTIAEIYGDTRLNTFFRPTSGDPSIYRGLDNGINSAQTSISLANYSLTGTLFREQTSRMSANFMTGWETLFLLAEAAQKGLVSGSAKTYYDDAVQQAFAYWQTAMPANYLSQGNAAFGNIDPLEQIITQKWIASITNGYEGWIEWRRTGFPRFIKPAAGSLNNGVVPVRMPYPTDEEALNATNFNQASANTNGNSVNSRVWWDNN